MGVQVWDIEAIDHELTSCYSPLEVRKFCDVLRSKPSELFDVNTNQPPVSPQELVSLIHTEWFNCWLTHEQVDSQSRPSHG